MGDEEQVTINDLSRKMDIATGAFRATGYLGGALMALVTVVFIYAFNKLETHDVLLTAVSRDIAVINAKEPGRAAWVRERLIWERKVDDALIRVSQ